MDKEKRTRCAVQIANDPNMLAFIEEMFLPEYSVLHGTTEKNILALDDEQYGKAMKLFYLKREENRLAIEKIKQIGKKSETKGRTNAPV